jgi:hypothetical protein
MLSTNNFIAKNNIYFSPDNINNEIKNNNNQQNQEHQYEVEIESIYKNHNTIIKDKNIILNENINNKIIKFEELSKNINTEKQVIRENTRLPQEFVDNLIQFNSNQNKKKLFESYENSDIVKLMKEVRYIIYTIYNIYNIINIESIIYNSFLA